MDEQIEAPNKSGFASTEWRVSIKKGEAPAKLNADLSASEEGFKRLKAVLVHKFSASANTAYAIDQPNYTLKTAYEAGYRAALKEVHYLIDVTQLRTNDNA